MCKVLQIAPSCYRLHAARQRNPELHCARAKRDWALIPEVQRVWHANWQVYGADKVWKQMNREGIRVARCTVERLMGKLGLAGARRCKAAAPPGLSRLPVLSATEFRQVHSPRVQR
jgi:putative transposase